ncbi:MAG TPA: hypothetical protein VI932_10025 [Bacteroidota bacterium]|nr:hypothetical protein [Bacteroidota bacterium]
MKKPDGLTRRTRSLLALLILPALFTVPAPAQFSDQVLRVEVGEYAPGRPLLLTIEFTNLNGIRAVNAAYRLFGSGTWTMREMQIIGNSALYGIPADELRPAVLEYWFSFSRTDGGADSTYPSMNPETQPLTTDLGPAVPESRALVVLSPDPGEHLNRDDVLISFSLARPDSSVDAGRTQIFLDGDDLSKHMVASDGLFVLRPDNAGAAPDGGSHTIRVIFYDTSGAVVSEKSWDFFVRGPRLDAPAGYAGYAGYDKAHEWTGRGNLRLETRNETVSNLVTPYNRATLDARATDGRFEFTGHLHLTSEEKDTRQPQHRFFLGAESPWVKLGYGDTYPVMPDMIISGKRVRGFSGALSAGFFDFEVVAGDIIRNVQGDTVRTFPMDSLAALQAADSTAAYGPYDTSAVPDIWAKFSHGTFDRSLLILRPSFKFGNSVFGITALHSKDDVASVTYAGAPEENAVAGADLTLSFDRKNIELKGQAGFSLYNGNIRGGTISDAEIDSIFSDSTYESFSRDDLRDARDIFSRFITVNENLVPLGKKNLSTLSWEGTIAVNYQPNNFIFTFLRHGASYRSFGQPFYRRDVEGFSVNDRVRLANNRFQLTAGIERLEDNTAGTKAATTTYTTVSGGASWLSRTDVPNITVGVLSMTNANPLAPSSLYSVDDNTLRFMAQLSRQVVLGARHFASVGFSASRRDDNSGRNLDSRNTSVSLSVVTDYDSPLRTTASAMFFSTKIDMSGAPVQDLAYTILFFGGEYRLMENRLVLKAAASPTLGDIKRTLLDAGARYHFTKTLSLEGKLDLYVNDAADTDVIWSMVLRADV